MSEIIEIDKEIVDDLQRILKVSDCGDLVAAARYLQREIKLYKKWVKAAAKVISVSEALMIPRGRTRGA